MNVVPDPTKISSELSTYRTVGDFELIHTLLREHSLYKIPQGLRASIVESINDVMEDPDSSLGQKLAASKLVLEMDKRNLDVIKIAMPQKHEHRQVTDLSDDELKVELLNIARTLDVPRIGNNERTLG